MTNSKMKQDRYLTVSRVGNILCCSDQFIYKLIKEGKITALRLGIRAIRISEKSLHEFIDSNLLFPDDYF